MRKVLVLTAHLAHIQHVISLAGWNWCTPCLVLKASCESRNCERKLLTEELGSAPLLDKDPAQVSTHGIVGRPGAMLLQKIAHMPSIDQAHMAW